MAKDILIKTDMAGNNFGLALLEYRNTPVDGLASPSQLLMNRNLRAIVLCTKELLVPKIIYCNLVQRNQIKQQSCLIKYHDQTHKRTEFTTNWLTSPDTIPW